MAPYKFSSWWWWSCILLGRLIECGWYEDKLHVVVIDVNVFYLIPFQFTGTGKLPKFAFLFFSCIAFFSVLLFYGPNFQADYRSCQILERCLRDNFWRQVDWYLFTASMIILCHTNHWKHSESLSVFCMTSDRFWHPHLQQASATSQAELAQSPLSNSVWWLHLLQHPLCGHYRGW